MTALGFQPADGGLIEHLPDRHRPAHLDDVEESLAPGLDLGFGRAGPSYGTIA